MHLHGTLNIGVYETTHIDERRSQSGIYSPSWALSTFLSSRPTVTWQLFSHQRTKTKCYHIHIVCLFFNDKSHAGINDKKSQTLCLGNKSTLPDGTNYTHLKNSFALYFILQREGALYILPTEQISSAIRKKSLPVFQVLVYVVGLPSSQAHSSLETLTLNAGSGQCPSYSESDFIFFYSGCYVPVYNHQNQADPDSNRSIRNRAVAIWGSDAGLVKHRK